MNATVLIVPDSPAAPAGHWPNWMAARLSGVLLPAGNDTPHVLDRRAQCIGRAIARSTGPVWIVAHGFGCLASVHAAAAHADKVAGALLVAPADPEGFVANGPRREDDDPVSRQPSISDQLPRTAPGFLSQLIAHDSVAGMRLLTAAQWAERWGSRLTCTDALGGIDPATHCGAWPQGLRLFQLMQRTQGSLPLGNLADASGQAHRRCITSVPE